VLHAARCKYMTQKSRQKSTSVHHRTTLSGYIFTTKAYIDNRKKVVKQQYLLHMSSYGGSVTARHSSSGRLPNFAALNGGRHAPIFGRAAITLGIVPHSSIVMPLPTTVVSVMLKGLQIEDHPAVVDGGRLCPQRSLPCLTVSTEQACDVVAINVC